eukprot:scaffold217_cov377-Prasinococcus_capsulatus_cf.AAC.13
MGPPLDAHERGSPATTARASAPTAGSLLWCCGPSSSWAPASRASSHRPTRELAVARPSSSDSKFLVSGPAAAGQPDVRPAVRGGKLREQAQPTTPERKRESKGRQP